MPSAPHEPDPAREFQGRRLRFIRIASIWTPVLPAALALWALVHFTADMMRQENPRAYWALVSVLVLAFGAVALHIHRAYERLFTCPRCSHRPQANELGVVLFLGWRAAGMDPGSCAVCGAKLK